VDVARRILERVLAVNLSQPWEYSGDTKPDYLNLEHPPLGKYIIASSMLTCGDNPRCWRLPSNLEAALMPVILYLGFSVKRVLRGSRREGLLGITAGLAASAAVASDVSLRYCGAIALLDIHQAFFEAVAIAFLASGSLRGFILGYSLAGSVKYSGFFLMPVAWAWIALERWGWRRRARFFLASIVVPALVLVAVSSPLILYLGPIRWYKEAVIGALGWHTTSRPPGPPTSTPLGWILNANPFYFSYAIMIGGETTTAMHVAAIAAGAFAIVYYISRNRLPAGAASYFSILGLYILLYIIGNKTLYSFYVVQLAPAAAAVYGDIALAGLVARRGEDEASSGSGE